MDSSTLLMDQDAKALEAAKRGDPHELRVYLDHFDVDVNLKDDETQGTLLHWACSYGRLGAVCLLLDRGADVAATDNERWTGLHWACHSAATDTARMLLERGSPIDERDSQEWTPFHVACHAGRTDTVRFLISAGASITARTERSLTALHIACESGFTDTARVLLEAGLSVSATDDEAYTPLHLASAGGHTDTVRLLLEFEASPGAATERNHRPLHLAAQYGHSPVVKLLIEAGAEVDVRDDGSYTPTHLACTYGHTETTRLLLENDADVEARDSEEWSPFHWACQLGNVYTARLLIAAVVETLDANSVHFGHPSSPGVVSHALNLGLGSHWESVVDTWYNAKPLYPPSRRRPFPTWLVASMEGANQTARTSRGHQALHLAAENGHTETVRMLLINGANPDVKDEVQYTPLHWAAQYGHLEVASLLLGKGAGPSEKADYRDTPLHLACLLGHGAMVALLLESGADPFAIDEDGKLPEEVVGMADGSKITDEERAVISRTVELKRRSLVSRAAVTATAAAVAPLDPSSRTSDWVSSSQIQGGDDEDGRGASGWILPSDERGGESREDDNESEMESDGVYHCPPMRRRTQASVPTFSRSTRSGINSGSEPGDRALRSIMPATGLSGTGSRVSGGGAIARSETGSRNSRRGSFQRPQVALCCSSGDCLAEASRLRTEQLDSTPKCVACLSRDRDTLLFPCKHLVLCGPCYSELMRCAAEPDEYDDDPYPTPTLARCPTCRAEICGHISGVIIS